MNKFHAGRSGLRSEANPSLIALDCISAKVRYVKWEFVEVPLKIGFVTKKQRGVLIGPPAHRLVISRTLDGLEQGEDTIYAQAYD